MASGFMGRRTSCIWIYGLPNAPAGANNKSCL